MSIASLPPSHTHRSTSRSFLLPRRTRGTLVEPMRFTSSLSWMNSAMRNDCRDVTEYTMLQQPSHARAGVSQHVMLLLLRLHYCLQSSITYM